MWNRLNWPRSLRKPEEARGQEGRKDWELKPFILEGDWTQYADVALHAGLICLNGPEGMDVDVQLELFQQALEELEADGDLINQVSSIVGVHRSSSLSLDYSYRNAETGFSPAISNV
jgi:hypothetical protein